MHSRYIYILIVIVLSGCLKTDHKKKIAITPTDLEHIQAQKGLANQTPPITVWVHGTRFLPRNTFKKLDFCPLGFNKASDVESIYYHRTLAIALSEAHPEKFPLETFYLFGWSGDLSFQVREHAGLELYQHLEKLTQDYEEKYKSKPIIRIITHSHGGNVALNLAVTKKNPSFSIEELIMLACPVQKKTSSLAHNPLFKKIYSLYSTLDSIQIMDPQGFYKANHRNKSTKLAERPLFSQRLFTNASNIVQIKLKINGHGIMHLGFVTRSFMHLLPSLLQHLDAWYIEHPETIKSPMLLSVKTHQKKSTCQTLTT